MSSMKELQKAVQNRKTANEEEIMNEKHQFEINKRDLEGACANINREIEESVRDVIR